MPDSVPIRRIFPWVVAIAIAGYVFRVVSIGEAWSALLRARLEIIVPLVVGTVLCWFLIESKAYAYVFSRFNAPVSWQQARALRGVTYLLSPIHLSLGKAALVLRLHTLKNVPLLEGTSTVALYQTIDAVVLAGLTAIGLWLIPTTPETGVACTAAIAVVLVLLFYLSFLRSDRPNIRVLDRARRLTIHHAHRKIRFRDAFVMVCAKLAYHLIAVAAFYFGTRAFGIDVPFTLVLATTPTIQAIGGLPITPGGLGTQQAAMLYFFGGYGSEAAIVAFGFSLPIAFMVMRSLLGLVYLPALTANAKLESPGPPSPRESDEAFTSLLLGRLRRSPGNP
jgi:uncharacterized membrane protein YbhN (UPF0104 family)